jgi:hypothetical protein
MGRWFSTPPTRSRAERTRRRVLYFAESLESRQLLSAAAFHPTVAPVGNIPALFGPAVAPGAANAGTTGVAASATPAIEVVVQINPVGAGNNVVENVFIVGGSFSSVNVAPTAASNAPSTVSPMPAIGNTSTSTSSSTASPATPPASITPLTATVLAGPPGASRAPIIPIIQPQAPVANLAPSTTPATTQAILATATLEEQPLPPPFLGQGFESGQTQGFPPRMEIGVQGQSKPERNEAQVPATDHIEPFQPGPVEAVPGAPDQPAVPPATPAPTPDKDAIDTTKVEPASLSEWGKSSSVPIVSPRMDSANQGEAPRWSMAAAVGAAFIASGGYHLVLRRSNRFNQRWLPLRKSKTARV